MKARWMNGSNSAGWAVEAGWGWWRWGLLYQTKYHRCDWEGKGILRIFLGWWAFAFFVPDVWLGVPDAAHKAECAAKDDAIKSRFVKRHRLERARRRELDDATPADLAARRERELDEFGITAIPPAGPPTGAKVTFEPAEKP